MIKPNEDVQALLADAQSSPLSEAVRAVHLLKRPEIKYSLIEKMVPADKDISDDVAEQVEIQVKYEGYIEKQLQQVARALKMEDKKIPENLDYHAISGLATEAKQKLSQVRPLSVGQASRVSGVNPADISILLIYLEQGKLAKVKPS